MKKAPERALSSQVAGLRGVYPEPFDILSINSAEGNSVSLPLRCAEGPEHFDCAQYKLRRGATGCYAMLAGRTLI